LLITGCVPLANAQRRAAKYVIFLQGTILRQSKSISTTEAAEYAHEMLRLSQKARHVVRDLDPKVCKQCKPHFSACNTSFQERNDLL
jgi:hypothetical protein